MKNLKKLIRKKIDELGSVQDFADMIKMRRASLYDFLNTDADIKLTSLRKIIDKIGFDILERLPDKLILIDCVYINKKKYKEGDEYKGNQILLCFGSSSTSHQAFIINTNEGMELIVI